MEGLAAPRRRRGLAWAAAAILLGLLLATPVLTRLALSHLATEAALPDLAAVRTYAELSGHPDLLLSGLARDRLRERVAADIDAIARLELEGRVRDPIESRAEGWGGYVLEGLGGLTRQDRQRLAASLRERLRVAGAGETLAEARAWLRKVDAEWGSPAINLDQRAAAYERLDAWLRGRAQRAAQGDR